MRLLTGQPEAMPATSEPLWQNGMPQSMQRAPCCWSFSSGMGEWNSLQSFVRSLGERSRGSSRLISMNPVGLPTVTLNSCLYLKMEPRQKHSGMTKITQSCKILRYAQDDALVNYHPRERDRARFPQKPP